MKPLKEFIIPFVGLKLGKHHFEYKINNTFFDYYEYEDFNSSSLLVNVLLEKKTTLLELNFKISGIVNINCDLTNEAFNQDINNSFDLVVNFGEEYNNEEIDLLIIPHGEYEINIQQYIYELAVLSLPSKRVHPGVNDGTLESDILDRLNELSPRIPEENNDEAIDPRWNTLKKLLTDK